MGCGIVAAAPPSTISSSQSNKAAATHAPITPTAVEPERPEALAVGPNGNLYVADTQRNQILERLSSGRFVVQAGSGKAGFSGDGGPSVDAKMNDPGGMVFGPHGTLYFADIGNHRVRAISPQGRITTVVGNGHSGWVANDTPALEAPVGPTAVAFCPQGDLVLADEAWNQVLELGRHGRLTILAGDAHEQGVVGIGGPAVQGSPDGPNGLAFNAQGDLFIAGNNTKALLMVTPTGTLRDLNEFGFYPRGNGGLVTAPDGTVWAMENQSLVQLGAQGATPWMDFLHKPLPDGLRNFLPNGLAVGPHGTFYTDTFYGNGYANQSAILAIAPNGSVKVLWRSGGAS